MSSLNGFTAILKRHINFNASIINSSLNSSSSCLAFRMSSSQVQGNSCVDGRTYKVRLFVIIAERPYLEENSNCVTFGLIVGRHKDAE